MGGGGGTASERAVIKVAAISGTLRKASFNRGLIRCAARLCQGSSVPGMEIDYVDIEPLPFFNADLEIAGAFPPAVEQFRRKIVEADAVLFAFPDYNYSLPAPLKNAIDWASRHPNVWANKTAAMVSAAGGSGGRRSQSHLRQVGVFLDLHFINKPELFIRAYEPPKKFDNNGDVIDPEIKERLQQILLSLQAFTQRLHTTS